MRGIAMGKRAFLFPGQGAQVVGMGKDIASAVQSAYDAVDQISFKGEYHRKDIAHRALNR